MEIYVSARRSKRIEEVAIKLRFCLAVQMQKGVFYCFAHFDFQRRTFTASVKHFFEEFRMFLIGQK